MNNKSSDSRVLILTDSLGSSSGGLGIASFRLACESARSMPEVHFLLVGLSDVDQDCVDTDLIPFNLDLKIVDCLRVRGYGLSWNLFSVLIGYSPQIIHVRGLWRFPSLVALLYKLIFSATRVIVQPAGMLEPWSLKQRQRPKKLYYRLVEWWLLEKATCIHATSFQEACNLVSFGIESRKIVVVSSGVDIPYFEKSQRSFAGSQRRLLFLSRIHPKKGLDILIEALSVLRPANWECVIAGSGDKSYVSQLESRINGLGLSDSVKLIGKVSGSLKQNVFVNSHAFVLPTFSENFGIAVAEAMSWALPVITTTATPWECLATDDMGWYIEPSVDSLCSALSDLFASTDDRLFEMGLRARMKIEANYSWLKAGRSMALTYSELMRERAS